MCAAEAPCMMTSVKNTKVRSSLFSRFIRGSVLSVASILLAAGSAGAQKREVTQAKQANRPLVVNGQTGEAPVIQINGRVYVDLGALASIGGGSLDFRANQIVLTIPGSSPSAPASLEEPERPVPSGLSRRFSMAAIESLAQMREWATTLAYAIEHSYGVTDAWASDYGEKAALSLRTASSSASTPSDQQALQLLTNEFAAVKQASDNLVEAKQTMDTAKYSTSPQALRDEPLSQKIIACYHFLGSMLGSGEFEDDPACH
jgi:hypothetical protein